MRDKFFAITKQVVVVSCEVTDQQHDIIFALYMQYGEDKAARFISRTYNIDADEAQQLLHVICKRYVWRKPSFKRAA